MMMMYVVTYVEGEYEDIRYEQTFYTNKEDAFKQVYNYCLDTYKTELARKTKKESKKRKGEWEAQNSREDFEEIMNNIKKEWDNYKTVTEKFDTDHIKAVWGHTYGDYCGDIGMSIIKIN